MLIVCPNCKKRFEYTPASTAPEVKLRCSSCRAVFRLVRKDAQAPHAPAAVAPAAHGQQGLVAPATSPLPKGEGQGGGAPAASNQRAPQAPVAPAAAPAPPPLHGEGRGGDGVPAAARPVAQAPAGALRVVIANESLAFCEAVQKVLASEQFELFICTDGKEALETVQQVRPDLLLLDVALPTMFGFEVCDRVRQDPALAGVKIVLIASIYDKTRYKRSPISLYGADDYLEKHHIPDSLIPMIYRLASGHQPAPTAPSVEDLALQQRSRQELRQAEVNQTQGSPQPHSPLPEQLDEAQLKARRLARIIVSDIALYSQAKVEQGVREGTFYTLLADDVREGELLYRQRVAESVRHSTSFLSEAFEELIAKKKVELGLSG